MNEASGAEKTKRPVERFNAVGSRLVHGEPGANHVKTGRRPPHPQIVSMMASFVLEAEAPSRIRPARRATHLCSDCGRVEFDACRLLALMGDRLPVLSLSAARRQRDATGVS